MKLKIDKEAAGIKLEWLMKNGKIRVYESVKVNVFTILNRASLGGEIPTKEKSSPYLVHVLNEDQEQIQEISVCKESFDYIKRVLKLKVKEEIK